MANVFKGSMQVVMKTRSKSNLPEKLQVRIPTGILQKQKLIEQERQVIRARQKRLE